MVQWSSNSPGVYRPLISVCKGEHTPFRRWWRLAAASVTLHVAEISSDLQSQFILWLIMLQWLLLYPTGVLHDTFVNLVVSSCSYCWSCRINSDLQQLNCWHKSELIHEGESGPGSGFRMPHSHQAHSLPALGLICSAHLYPPPCSTFSMPLFNLLCLPAVMGV